jgi:Mg/Co/Ni transporter MgtE
MISLTLSTNNGDFSNTFMSLEKQIQEILVDFENTSSNKILEILNQIKPHFQSQLISEYLQGKIQKILDVNDETEKKKQCKALTPYLDWYLQGL